MWIKIAKEVFERVSLRFLLFLLLISKVGFSVQIVFFVDFGPDRFDLLSNRASQVVLRRVGTANQIESGQFLKGFLVLFGNV